LRTGKKPKNDGKKRKEKKVEAEGKPKDFFVGKGELIHEEKIVVELA